MPIDPKLVKWDAPAIDPGAVKWDDEVTLGEKVTNVARDLAAGAVRGAGSIGATLLTPIDAAARALGVQNDFIGRDDRRTGMDAGLQTLGADPNSTAYTVGKVGAEVAGTAGVGGVLANSARAAGAAAPVVEALTTSGLRAAGAKGLQGLALRTAAGAATGGAAATLVDPDQAKTGVLVGAALPGVVKGLGAAGEAVTRTVIGPAVPAAVTKAAKDAKAAGYVLPPTQVKPTLGNRLLEGFAGKVSTAQAAAARNQVVTNNLARRALGLGDDVELTPEALDAVRAQAGQAYSAVSRLGKLDATGARLPGVAVETGTDPLLLTKTSQVDAGEVVRAWKQANADASAWFRAADRSANPEDLAKAHAAADAARQIDEFLSGQLQAMGRSDLLKALKDARVQIAKSHNIERVLSGAQNVDARKLAAQLKKGAPLSGELRQAAEFGGSFPKAAQMPEVIGSQPGSSPIDWIGASSLGAATGSPLALGWLAGRPLARAAALSSPVQSRLSTPVGRFFEGPALSDAKRDAIQLLLARAAPVGALGQ